MTRKRKPYGLKATKPHEIIEFDMKHIYVEGRKLYAMCAIDTFTREAAVRGTGTATSYQAREMLKRLVQHFGKDITIVCDNGSENGGFAERNNLTAFSTSSLSTLCCNGVRTMRPKSCAIYVASTARRPKGLKFC